MFYKELETMTQATLFTDLYRQKNRDLILFARSLDQMLVILIEVSSRFFRQNFLEKRYVWSWGGVSLQV